MTNQKHINYFIVFSVWISTFIWGRCFHLSIFNMVGKGGIAWGNVYVVLFLLAGTSILFFSRPVNIFNNFYMKCLIGIAIIVLIPIFLTSTLLFNQSIFILIRQLYFFGGYLIFPLLVLYRLPLVYTYYTFYGLMALTALSAIIVITVSIIPSLSFIFEQYAVAERFGILRVGLRTEKIMTQILIAFTLSLFIHSKNKAYRVWSFISFIVLIYMVTFIWMKREVALSLMIFFSYMLVLKSTLNQKIISAYICGLSITLLMLFFDSSLKNLFDIFFRLFNTSVYEYGAEEGTIGIRLSGIEYYFKLFKETNFIGLGSASTTVNINNPLSQGLLLSHYNFADIGVFETLFRFGIQAIIFLVFICRKLFIDIKNIKRKGTHNDVIIAETFRLYLLIQLLSFPFTKMFFAMNESLYYGLIMFFIWRLSEHLNHSPNHD